jgi:cytochrome c-type biogenesis protein CcmH
MSARGPRAARACGLLTAAALVCLFSAAPSAPQAPAAGGDPKAVVGPPHGQALSGAALDARTEDVASLLRCPVCQGLSVADSPAEMAVNMKTEVRELLARGYEQEQILAYFEHSYGEFVRLRPPLRGVNWLVWLLPFAALAAGAWFVRRALAGRRGAAATPSPSEPVPGPGTLPDDPELARCVRRVRELAYGWPDGEPPSAEA